MVIAVLFLVTSVVAGGGHGKEENKLPALQAPNLPASQASLYTGFLQRRDVPEALVDPYSVLGVLSFGVYIFYILYHRYQMGMSHLKNHMGVQPGVPGSHHSGGSGNTPTPTSLFTSSSEQNLAYILEVASKILSNAAKAGNDSINGTTPLMDTFDYYDDNGELQAST